MFQTTGKVKDVKTLDEEQCKAELAERGIQIWNAPLELLQRLLKMERNNNVQIAPLSSNRYIV